MSSKTQTARLSLEEKVELFKSRFVAREDAFYEKYWGTVQKKDATTGEKTYEPGWNIRKACANYGNKEKCLITQRKGGCSDCSNSVADLLTDSWIKKHIIGEKTICLVPITENGIRMGAIDFDASLGEGREAIFEDAKKVRDFCKMLGIPSYIARSSNKGYHLYFWFNNWIPAHHFTSFALFVFHETGFVERQNAGMALPEVFPKQTAYNPNSIGNSIRVPMSENDIKNGKNCFVDDTGQAYSLAEQWSQLAKMETITPDQLKQVLDANEVEIFADPVPRMYNADRQKKYVLIQDENGVEKVVPRAQVKAGDRLKVGEVKGSFWNIVAACPAMQEYWARNEKGEYTWDTARPNGLFHAVRLASLSLAVMTNDGPDIIRKRWPTSKTDAQIIDATNKLANVGGFPQTCATMQDEGVCIKTKHPCNKPFCYPRLPPMGRVMGKLVSNPDNVPEEQWPSPSPVRFREDWRLNTKEICERFMTFAKVLSGDAAKEAGKKVMKLSTKEEPEAVGAFWPDTESIPYLRESLVKVVVRLPEEDRDHVTNYVISNKLVKKTEWDSWLKKAKKAVTADQQNKEKSNSKHFVLNGKTYWLKNDHITTTFVNQKGEVMERSFSNFWIEREKESAKIRLVQRSDKEEVAVYEDRMYSVIIHINGQKRAINVHNREFATPSEFFRCIRSAIGTEGIFESSKESYDAFAAAINYFSDPLVEQAAMDSIGYYTIKGKKRYLMPSVSVTKDEIAHNDTFTIDNMDDDFTRCLDFQMLDTDQFKQLSRHIIKDYFNCNNPMVTMSVFAHAMTAVCTEIIGDSVDYRKSPVLWLAGDFSQGKSFVTDRAQSFFGNFKSAGRTNAGGSFKAKIGVANAFRHALLCLEDHKDTTANDGGRGVSQFVQQAYDRNIMPALNRDGKMRKNANRAKCMIIIDGEDFPDRDASVLSRLIIVDTKLEPRREEGARVLEQQHLYSGFTAYVVRHVLNITTSAAKALWDETFARFVAGSSKDEEKSGLSRLCENLTMNFFGFRIALDTMVAHGAISLEEAKGLSEHHFRNLMFIKQAQLQSVFEARGSEAFLRDVQQLLSDPKRFQIFGWPGAGSEESDRATTLGYWTEKEPGVVFLYSSAYTAVVDMNKRRNTTVQSQRHIVRQLFNDGHFESRLLNREKYDTYMCTRRGPSGMVQKVYPIKASSLGMDEVANKAAGRQAGGNTSSGAPPVKKSSNDDEFDIE